MKYAGGKTKGILYRIGLSANTLRISSDVYVGVEDKNIRSPNHMGRHWGRRPSGCIEFKALKDVNIDVLEEAIRFGLEA